MNDRNKNNITKLVLAGLLAAFVTVSTLLIQIPTPSKGYVNLGDCFVNISAWILGPIYGSAAAGIGSALADLISGYAIYAPATFVIKALMAVVSFFVFKLISKRTNGLLARIIASVGAEIVMVVGYFIFELALYGFAGSIVGVIPNMIQGVAGVVIAVVLHEALVKHIPIFKKII